MSLLTRLLEQDRSCLLDRGLPDFADRAILVLGDIMLDRYVTGQVRRTVLGGELHPTDRRRLTN